MKRSDIYHRAAEFIDSGKENFSCTAIRNAKAIEAYCNLYELGDGYNIGAEDEYPNLQDLMNKSVYDTEKRKQRVYMLLLAAAVATV